MKKNSLNLKKLVEDITGIENIYSMKGICPEQEPLLCMPQQIEIVEVSKVQAEDNTKKECDHIVGVEFGCEECQERNELTKLSEIANIETKENCTWFKHCPECGEKLNLKIR